jgi:hypothetical protein
MREKVRDLPEEALLIQDSQERRAVLESAGLPKGYLEAYPTLFVLVGNAEIERVWGLERFTPYLDAEAELIYSRQG